jgi:rubrerythrin
MNETAPSTTSPSDLARPDATNRFDRRTMLRAGGITLSLGAILAACGDGRGGLEEPGRVGTATPGSSLPDAPVNDLTYLRTAQSLEHTAIDVYETALGLNLLSSAQVAVVNRFIDDHRSHSAALGRLISGLGGQTYTCANPWIMERDITAVLERIQSSDDPTRDVLATAHALESLAGATYQHFTALLSDRQLRKAAMTIGADEHRHSATLAMAITGSPAGYISPALFGEEVEPTDAGFPIPYAIPTTFGSVSSTELVVGARDADGARLAIGLQTPAENSYVYEFMSCS